MKKVTRTERGWIGHFCLADRCRFRRNTLLECDGTRIVVSTVGLLVNQKGDGFEDVGSGRFFETRAFHSLRGDDRFKDIDISREVYPASPCFVKELDADDKANDMHETVCAEIEAGLSGGNDYALSD